MKEYALLIDYKYCTGCHSCEIACHNEKKIGNQEEWGIKLTQHGPIKLNGQWMWNFVPVPSELCDLCVGRLEAGEDPACVHHCLAQCMEVVKIADVSARLAMIGDTAAVFVP